PAHARSPRVHHPALVRARSMLPAEFEEHILRVFARDSGAAKAIQHAFRRYERLRAGSAARIRDVVITLAPRRRSLFAELQPNDDGINPAITIPNRDATRKRPRTDQSPRTPAHARGATAAVERAEHAPLPCLGRGAQNRPAAAATATTAAAPWSTG